MESFGKSLGQNQWGQRPLWFWPWDFPRDSIHHDTPSAFPQIVPVDGLARALHWGLELLVLLLQHHLTVLHLLRRYPGVEAFLFVGGHSNYLVVQVRQGYLCVQGIRWVPSGQRYTKGT